MLRFILFIVTVFCIVGFSQIPDIVKKNFEGKSKTYLKSQIDTINTKVDGSLKISPSKKNTFQQYPSFFGALIGAFLAGIIAIYSVWKTNRNNLELERKKYHTQREVKENIYCGILFSIFTDLHAHTKISEILKTEIEDFLEYYKSALTIPTDSPFSDFPIEFIKICRNKVLDFYKFETTSFSILTHYINVLDSLQADLNLRRLREARLNIIDEKQLFAGMKGYFDQVLKTLSTLDDLRKELTEKIPEIIESYPQSDIKDLISKVKES